MPRPYRAHPIRIPVGAGHARPVIACLALLFVPAGCAPVDETPMISLIGATLIDGTGGAPVPESVVVVVGSRVREAGGRATVPSPARARNVDARGKFVTLRLIDPGQTQLAAAATNDELRKLLDSGVSAYGSLALRDSVFAPAHRGSTSAGDAARELQNNGAPAQHKSQELGTLTATLHGRNGPW